MGRMPGIPDICLKPLGSLLPPLLTIHSNIFNTKLYYIQKIYMHPAPTITGALQAWDLQAGIPPGVPPSRKAGPPGCPFSLVATVHSKPAFFNFLILK